MSNMQISALRRMAFAGVLIRIAAAGCIGDTTSDNSTDSPSGWTIIDSVERKVEIPAEVDRVICSSGGTCTRHLVYIDVADRIAANREERAGSFR